MRPKKKKQSRRFRKLAVLVLVVLFITIVVMVWRGSDSSSNSATDLNNKIIKSTSYSSGSFNKHLYSIDEVASLWATVNKGRVLPSDYSPSNLIPLPVPLRLAASNPEMHLRQEAAVALQKLFTAASSQSLRFMLASGYRSFSEQAVVYGNEVRNYGQAVADSESARPGHSEHQTGLAADVEPASRTCELQACFGESPEGRWLAANAYRYGFIIRYQKGQENQTGYRYEPWHVRFVGRALAAEIHRSQQTMEQFFGLSPFQNYPASSYVLKD